MLSKIIETCLQVACFQGSHFGVKVFVPLEYEVNYVLIELWKRLLRKTIVNIVDQ